MGKIILIVSCVAVLLCTAESLQIRKTLKLQRDGSSESIGDKPEVDGEREEVYNFFDKRYGQNEEDLRTEEISVDQQQNVVEEMYDGMSDLMFNEIDGEEAGPETDYVHPMKLPKSEGIEELTLESGTVAHGVMERGPVPYRDSNYVDLFRQVLATSARTLGSEVTLEKDSSSAKAKALVRLFRKDGHSKNPCSPSDPTKIVDAHCGNHYLFPGQSLRLVSSSNCIWRFRHLSPEVVLSMNGVQLDKEMLYTVEERLVTTSVKTVKDVDRMKLAPTKKPIRELVVSGPETFEPNAVDAEICVPSAAGDLLSEYDSYDATCCSRNIACGLPEAADRMDKKLDMRTFPWEALLTIREMAPSETGETWCSGSLISTEWILTTASCFIRNGVLVGSDTDYAPEVVVSFGLLNVSKALSVSEIHVFPTVTETHDIALVRLKEPSPRVPVCLPAYSKPSPARNLYNREGLVFGWVVNDGKPYMNVLKQKILSSDKCSIQMGKRLPPHVVCTADSRPEPCLADGDLLTVAANGQYYLSGLSLPRLKCVDNFRPHTAVAYFMNWISNVTAIPMPYVAR